MRLKVVLFGLYREKLPKQARGEADLDVPEATTVAEVLAQLGLNMGVMCVLNGQTELDKAHILQEGDRLQVIPPVGGG